MRRTLVLIALAAAALGAGPAQARSLRDGKKMISCPDPTVIDAHVGRYRYYMACTSDGAADVFPLRGSNDLVHFKQLGYAFDRKHQPWWALHTPKEGHYWAPALYRIANRWVLYFAAQHNPRRLKLTVPDEGTVPASNMMIGVATATSLKGPWHSHVLHYRGQFNATAGEHEGYGGVIDPSVVRDGATGQLYLFWAEQHSSIWVAGLSPDGLRISPQIHQVMWTQPGWECNTPKGTCVVEGPEEYYRDGWFYLFYSGASTWTGSYAIGVAASQDPMVSQFQRLDHGPALRSGNGYIGPGGSSAPVTGPDGRSYIFYHALTRPDPHHDSAVRYLFSSPIRWKGLGGYDPVIGSGQVDLRTAFATAPVDQP
jgi:xylan 1,4-beta-xylosidase